MSTAEENTTKDLKPTHRSRFGRFSPSMGWKAFWSEILIVVLGIVIALGATEIAEEWNWQHKVAAGEVKLKQEAGSNFLFAAEQVSVAPCVDAQLEALQKRLLSSGDMLVAAPIFKDDFATFTYRVPSRPDLLSAWQAINNDGTASHMDDWRHMMFVQLYAQVSDMVERTRQSNVHFTRSTMLSSTIPLDPATRAMLLGELIEQRGQSRLNSVVAGQIMSDMRDLGLTPPAKYFEESLQQSGTMKFCKKQGLPLADWKQELAKETVQEPL